MRSRSEGENRNKSFQEKFKDRISVVNRDGSTSRMSGNGSPLPESVTFAVDDTPISNHQFYNGDFFDKSPSVYNQAYSPPQQQQTYARPPPGSNQLPGYGFHSDAFMNPPPSMHGDERSLQHPLVQGAYSMYQQQSLQNQRTQLHQPQYQWKPTAEDLQRLTQAREQEDGYHDDSQSTRYVPTIIQQHHNGQKMSSISTVIPKHATSDGFGGSSLGNKPKSNAITVHSDSSFVAEIFEQVQQDTGQTVAGMYGRRRIADRGYAKQGSYSKLTTTVDAIQQVEKSRAPPAGRRFRSESSLSTDSSVSSVSIASNPSQIDSDVTPAIGPPKVDLQNRQQPASKTSRIRNQPEKIDLDADEKKLKAAGLVEKLLTGNEPHLELKYFDDEDGEEIIIIRNKKLSQPTNTNKTDRKQQRSSSVNGKTAGKQFLQKPETEKRSKRIISPPVESESEDEQSQPDRDLSGEDSLFFKKEPRKVSYKPYTKEDYQKITPQGYYTLGTLGPDLNSEELLAKRGKIEKMKKFAKQINKMNAQQTVENTPADPETIELQKKIEKQASSSRTRALQFASRIPKPKVKPASTTPDIASSDKRSATGKLKSTKANERRRHHNDAKKLPQLDRQVGDEDRIGSALSSQRSSRNEDDIEPTSSTSSTQSSGNRRGSGVRHDNSDDDDEDENMHVQPMSTLEMLELQHKKDKEWIQSQFGSSDGRAGSISP